MLSLVVGGGEVIKPEPLMGEGVLGIISLCAGRDEGGGVMVDPDAIGGETYREPLAVKGNCCEG